MSFLPSILPSVCNFSRNWLIIFFWNLACCQGSIYSYMWQSRSFWKRNPHRAKMARIDQKWPKNRVFGLFKKIMSLVLSGICVKWKFLRFINILRKILVKTWLSSYSKYLLSANEISVFFNCQCFTNRLISDFDFWHVHRLEWKEQFSLTGFLKKFSFGQMGHCMSKNFTSS